MPSIRSLGVAKSVKWADEEGEKLVDTKDNPKWINAPQVRSNPAKHCVILWKACIVIFVPIASQMVDGERLIDDFDNNSDLYDFDLKPSDAFDIRSLLTTGKVHPEPAAVVHVPHRRGDYKTRENFKMGCLEYIVLACWGVFLVTAGGYIAMRLFQKAHND